MSQQSQREGEYYETNMRDKDDIITDLKKKIYSLDKENAELSTKVKGLELKLNRVSKDYEDEMQNLEDKVEEMKQENKTLRMPSSNNLGDDNSDLRRKVETLEKQLERKQELLKRMTDMRKEADSERNLQNLNLRQQIADLKETVERL